MAKINWTDVATFLGLPYYPNRVGPFGQKGIIVGDLGANWSRSALPKRSAQTRWGLLSSPGPSWMLTDCRKRWKPIGPSARRWGKKDRPG